MATRSRTGQVGHQQYLQRNKNGYCPDNGTGVSCRVGLFAKTEQ